VAICDREVFIKEEVWGAIERLEKGWRREGKVIL